MQVIAKANNIRVSPEKVRLVVDQIKKMEPARSMVVLKLVHKSSAKPLIKVIGSAIANAKNNFGLDEQSLAFKSILVGIGPMFKRFQPVARGRAHSILKRTSHITVILEGEEKKKTEATKETKKLEEPKEKNGTKS
ncbi:50S ribosomal protein L22 [Candidatus Curtissbacteria bacterium RIFCSPHIGHO2_01_FULL_41_11]|uniref:Large ribosomal subunit protein uL22 n=1 Tax=Candidatus Curtissbacteria bacterium RIFCSPHIGHO2_01_FULL_41_11 TaxID=1797711 RepID=A0A1F5G3M4_9BACT|nr:MAG: 50S ribosomal protein L22 [Candidatus Curtissbacteria bacterium RIFCSPHIGHO2_01_FULL_41_11]